MPFMKTRYVSIFKAASISNEKIPNLELSFKVPCSDIESFDLESIAEIFDDQAQTLANELHNTLPQGIFDRLIFHLMNKKVSTYFGKDNGKIK